MGSVGRVIAIVAGIVGILSVVLFMVMPDFFAFWSCDVSGFAPLDFKLWIGGFAQRAGEGTMPIPGMETDVTYTEDMILTIISIVIIAGGALSIIGGVIQNRIIGLLGGIAMLLGVVAFIVGLAIQFGDFADLGDIIEVFGGENLLFGSGSIPLPPLDADWGLGFGAYFGIGAAAAGIIGGILIES